MQAWEVRSEIYDCGSRVLKVLSLERLWSLSPAQDANSGAELENKQQMNTLLGAEKTTLSAVVRHQEQLDALNGAIMSLTNKLQSKGTRQHYRPDAVMTSVHMLPTGTFSALVAGVSSKLVEYTNPQWSILGGLTLDIITTFLLPFADSKER
jgi:hypothetical protein